MTIGALYKKLRTDICDYGGKGVKVVLFRLCFGFTAWFTGVE